MKKRIALLSGIALFTLAACSSSGDSSSESSGVEVKSIEPILSSEIVIEPDAAGTTATLAVDTSIPVSCSVIYGTDESFGLIAVDSDMQGGAHEDHGPLMTGLVPDTEYKYILQGSDASGFIYRSDVMTFRTPAATDNGLGENLAPTGTISGASSSFSDSFAPELAIDGDLATEWSSAGDGDDAWIELTLPEPAEISTVAFKTRQMTDGSAITETFTITVDGTELGPFTAGPTPVALDEPVTGTVIRFDADQTTGGNTGAVEIEIYS